MRRLLAAAMLAACAACVATPAHADEARIESLLVRLTPAEKLDLLAGDGFETHRVPRLGIAPLRMADGPAGVRDGVSTAFPVPIALAATWDTSLVREVSGAIAVEARAKGKRMMLGPCVNIARLPWAGRTFEAFGEDPWLASRMAVAYVHGLQEHRVAATVKHFAANSQEANREAVDEHIDERTLREIYLPAFDAAVREAGAWSVMSAYNKVNGNWCSENPWLLRDVLKTEWRFDGLVVSDWGAVHSTLPTVRAGLDLEMPDHKFLDKASLATAVERGEVSWPTIDASVKRLLRLLERTGVLDGDTAGDPGARDGVAHRALARTAAARSLVLLRNEGGALPLDRAHLRSLAVIGPNAAVARTGGGGSSYVTTAHAVSPLEAIRRAAGPGVTVTYAAGASAPDDVNPIDSTAFAPASGPGHGLRAEYWASQDFSGAPALVRTDASVNFDFGDGSPAAVIPVDHFSARWTGTLVAPTSGRWELRLRADDGVRLWLDGKLVLEDWSDHGARTVATIVPLRAGEPHAVKLEYYENGGGAVVQFGWHAMDQDEHGAAVAAARGADAAIVVVGNTAGVESEGFDRPNLALPVGQDALIRAVAAVNPRTIVVVVAGSPVTMGDWLERVRAVLQAWYPGVEGGSAIADVLFGDAAPSGRLPISFPRRWADVSAAATYSSRDLATRYDDGVFVGYRHHDRAGIAPEFPFGFGLGYTTFAYSDLAIEPPTLAAPRHARVSFTVANTGARAGAEVPQLYVAPPRGMLPRPVRELKGFARVELTPGESRRVTIELDERAFAAWDPGRAAWWTEPGRYAIEVGASSRDTRLSGSLTLAP